MIRFPMRRSLHTLAGGVLLASTALAPVARAKAPPITDSVAVPMPPTPAGSAPGNLLGQPIAADDGTAQTVHPGTPVAKDWWLAFCSPAINSLVDRALTANADLIAAKARLAQAQALVGVARGALLPQLDAGLTSERQRLSRSLSTPLANPDPQVFSLHTAQVSVSYSPICSAEARRECARPRQRLPWPLRKPRRCARWWRPTWCWP
ncbi:TolC family protein [Novosphingobium pokkalii]|uniref:TolC family protein n=1 Tax=Novosphingobium pokkalii TaxID=1770194 RepID=UPI00362D101E